MTGNERRSGLALLFNLLTLLIVALIILVVAGFVVALTSPELVEPLIGGLGLGKSDEVTEPTPTLVAVAIVPTSTSTPTPNLLISPTWTPQGQQPPAGATATNTRRPTGEPTITPTFPPPTATPTPTDTPTATPTPGPSPTATQTRAPFPFTRSDSSPIYEQNFANAAGCNWMGIGGDVLDLNRSPVPAGQYRVHVWDCGIDERATVGGAPAYGPSGYEQFIFNAPVIRQCNVQLETANGTAVSQVYAVDTRASCNQNLVLFYFVQNH